MGCSSCFDIIQTFHWVGVTADFANWKHRGMRFMSSAYPDTRHILPSRLSRLVGKKTAVPPLKNPPPFMVPPHPTYVFIERALRRSGEIWFQTKRPVQVQSVDGTECGKSVRNGGSHHRGTTPLYRSYSPRTSTMPLISKRRVLAALDADIQVLYCAKDVCKIQPAQAAFLSSGDLLAAIRVRSLISCDDEL